PWRAGVLERPVLHGAEAVADSCSSAGALPRDLRLGILGRRRRRGSYDRRHGREVPEAAARRGFDLRRQRGHRHARRRHRARRRSASVEGGTRSLSRGPEGSGDARARDEGLGLALAPAAVGARDRAAVAGESVLARALRELQDLLSLPRRELHNGGERARALHQARFRDVHSRHSSRRRGAPAHGSRLRAGVASRARAGRDGRPHAGLTAADRDAPLAARFLRSAELFRDRPALEAAGSTLTYGELRRRAQGVARLLLARDPAGAGPQLTAVFASRSVDAFAGILGIILRGHGYVPLNPRFPALRTRDMLERARCRVLLVDPEHLDAAREMTEGLAKPPALLPIPAEKSEEDVVLPAGGPDAPAYLLFTSGSTGRPKGVLVRQANVAAELDGGEPLWPNRGDYRLHGSPLGAERAARSERVRADRRPDRRHGDAGRRRTARRGCAGRARPAPPRGAPGRGGLLGRSRGDCPLIRHDAGRWPRLPHGGSSCPPEGGRAARVPGPAGQPDQDPRTPRRARRGGGGATRGGACGCNRCRMAAHPIRRCWNRRLRRRHIARQDRPAPRALVSAPRLHGSAGAASREGAAAERERKARSQGPAV